MAPRFDQGNHQLRRRVKIHWNITQCSPEWLALRSAYFTASELGAWLIEPDKNKTSRNAWQNALESKLAAMSKDEAPEFDTWEMRRGRELEPVARAEYEQVTGFCVQVPGFISHDSDGFGCSPDGLITVEDTYVDRVINEDGNQLFVVEKMHGLEIKCPVAKTMLRWIREGLADGVLPDEHKLQVHACLAVTGLDRWDFLAYHPEFRPQIISVMRDDFTRRVEEGLLKLSDDFSEYKAKIGKYLR